MLSDIKIWPSKGQSNFKANGEVTFHEAIRIQFKVVQGKNGLFVSFPQEKYDKEGETKYKNQVTFVNPEVQTDVQSRLIAAYNKQVSGGAPSEDAPIASPKQKPKNLDVPF